jgi:uncharacterized DUF497 family protein
MPFEWDAAKRLSNVAKHGIDFEDAKQVFADPRHFTSPSTAHPDRHVAIGMVQGRVIAVVFAQRGDTIRVISARAASRAERSRYG